MPKKESYPSDKHSKVLRVFPRKLMFTEPWGTFDQDQILRLQNLTKCPIAYRIMVTEHIMYIVSPKVGFIRRNKVAYVGVHINYLDKVNTLAQQGMQIETIPWKEQNSDEEEALKVFRSAQETKTKIDVQQVVIEFPKELVLLIPPERQIK